MPHKKKSPFMANLELSLARGFAGFLRLLPYSAAQKFGASVAVFFHDVVGVRKKKAIEQLLIAFPDKDENWAAKITRGVYRNFGMLAAEMAYIPKLIKNFNNHVVLQDGAQHLQWAVENGKGAIIVSGHFGNWETAGALAATLGFPISFLVGSQSNKGIEELLDEYRKASGIEIIKKADAIKGVMKHLKRNRIIAFMIDQDAKRAGVFVPFFGVQSSTPRGPALFALKFDAPVLFMNTWRDPDGTLNIKVDRVDFPKSGDREQDIVDLTAELTARIEAQVRQYPDQWLWLHKRWKTPPPVQNEE